MTVLDLRRLQTTLLAELSDAPGTKDVVRQQKEAPARDDAPSVIVLLAAVAVALAWWTYRGKAAPAPNIRRVFDVVTDGHSYLLPIPRSQPCFCGDGIQFKDCHGRPPNAAPFTGGNLTVVRASSG